MRSIYFPSTFLILHYHWIYSPVLFHRYFLKSVHHPCISCSSCWCVTVKHRDTQLSQETRRAGVQSYFAWSLSSSRDWRPEGFWFQLPFSLNRFTDNSDFTTHIAVVCHQVKSSLMLFKSVKITNGYKLLPPLYLSLLNTISISFVVKERHYWLKLL